MASRASRRAAWKRHERQTAADLGSRRNPNNGQRQSDIDLPAFAVEHKEHATYPKWFTGAMEQSVAAAASEQTPIVVFFHPQGRGRKPKRYVLMRYEDAREWFGIGDEPSEETA